jgi:hypothetical protein
MSDEIFFGAATKELSLGIVDQNLLAKARVLAGGDKKSTELEYIKLRVEQLKSDSKNRFLVAIADSAGKKLPAVGNVLWYGLAVLTVLGFIVWLAVLTLTL